ncbi:MAG TPA: DUF6378 domain-containing protein [Geminicoccaceae bacterium]|nr:DUF6378 domain-containing protein [Geminicoccaceae bacterium]
MTADESLRHAAAVVRDRRSSYGDPADLFGRVAARWPQVIGAEVTPVQVGLCLLDLKLARLAADPHHLDSLVDVAGYAACVREISR